MTRGPVQGGTPPPGQRIGEHPDGRPGYDPNGNPNLWEARPQGVTWYTNAASLWQQRNRIDPTTGRLIGPDSLVPANMGLQAQAEHNRRVWDYRQSLMRDAHSYGMGSLGLLQSFRPGGGATIESGQYNNLAQIQLNRAAMTEPMDLLADYRRHENATARSQANRMAERQMAVQIGIALAGVATAGIAAAAAPAALGAWGAMGAAAIGAAGNIGAASMMKSAPQAGAGGVGGMAAAQGMQQYHAEAMRRYQMGLPPVNQPQSTAPQQPGGGGAAPPQAAPLQLGAPEGGGGAPGTQQATLAPEGAAGASAAGGPQARAGGAQGAQGAPAMGGGMGGGMMGGRPAVGADGQFLPTNYAAAGAMASDPITSALLTKQVADSVDNDPFYAAYNFAVNARFAQRMGAA